MSSLEVEDEGYGARMAWGMTHINSCVGTGLPLGCSNGSLIRLSENVDRATPRVEVGGEDVTDNTGELFEWAAPLLVEG